MDEKEERGGERTAAIKYNYFPIEWKLFGNERRVIGDIHTFIKRFSLLLSFSFSLVPLPFDLRPPLSWHPFLLQCRSEMYSRHSRQIKPSATILSHCSSGRGCARPLPIAENVITTAHPLLPPGPTPAIALTRITICLPV